MDTCERQRANRRLTLRIGIAALAMFGFGFALAPLYDVFCSVTGLNGKTRDAPSSAHFEADAGRTVTVEFLATVNGGRGWGFAPETVRMEVHPGRAYVTHYTAANPDPAARTIQAVPSVTPGRAARYLHKTECFCFTRQRFEAGESRRMPLRFMVDPALPEEVGTLSLAYTLFELEETAQR